MLDDLRHAISRRPVDLAQDFLGAAALIAMLVIALHMPVLF
jgi:hypothetical protein